MLSSCKSSDSYYKKAGKKKKTKISNGNIKTSYDTEQCKEVLRNEVYCTLAMIGDYGCPYAIPLHFTYDEKKNIIYLHGAKEGHKIDTLRKNRAYEDRGISCPDDAYGD